MTNRTSRLLCAAGLPCLAAALVWNGNAAAQTVPVPDVHSTMAAPKGDAVVKGASDQPNAADDPKDIIVTASRHGEQTLLKTPMSITAFSADTLREAGITNINQALIQTPGAYLSYRGTGRTVYNIRGIASDGGSSPTVGFYLDDTPITPPINSAAGKTPIDPSLYDLERVEVLRGPQGSLYGASSLGGTIRLLTQQPKDRFEASAEFTPSWTNPGGFNFNLNGMINIPLVKDALALRLVTTDSEYDGYIDRVVLANFPALTTNAAGQQVRGDVTAVTPTKVYKNANSTRTRTFRPTLLVKPTDNLSITGAVFVERQHQDGFDFYDAPPGSSQLAHYQPIDMAEPASDKFELYSLTGKWSGPGFDVTSSTSFFNRRMYQSSDQTEPYAAAFGTAFLASPDIETHRAHQFAQEVRITSNRSGPFQWLVGGYYSNFTDTYRVLSLEPGLLPLFGSDNVITYAERDSLRQIAAFGEASYEIVPGLKATLGLRAFKYKEAFTLAQSGIIYPNIASVLNNQGSVTKSGTTPKFSLSYQGTPDLLFYATRAKGFRPGGVNLPLPTGAVPASCTPALGAIGLTQAPQTFGPDTVWSNEIGAKGSLFGRALSFDGSLFYIDWHDVQQQVRLSCGFQFNDNEGKAVSKGADFHATVRPGAGFTFDGGFSYTEASLSQNTSSGGIKGQQLRDVPRWTFNGSADWRQPITDKLTLFGHGTYQHIGRTRDAAASFYIYEPPYKNAYDVASLRAGVGAGPIEVAAFVENLTDARPTLVYGGRTGLPVAFLASETTLRPRTIGLDLRYAFK